MKNLSRALVAALVLSSALGVGLAAAPESNAVPMASQMQMSSNGIGSLGYPDFKTFEVSGKGNRVVKLPAARSAAMVTVTHDGERWFTVRGLDADNERTETVVSERGAISGTYAFGLGQFSSRNAVSALQVEADGNWTIKVESVNNAPALPKSGSGAGVYRWNNPSTVWDVSHNSTGRISIEQYVRRRTGSGISSTWLVLERGNWNGEVAAQGGPSIVTIEADGPWRISR